MNPFLLPDLGLHLLNQGTVPSQVFTFTNVKITALKRHEEGLYTTTDVCVIRGVQFRVLLTFNDDLLPKIRGAVSYQVYSEISNLKPGSFLCLPDRPLVLKKIYCQLQYVPLGFSPKQVYFMIHAIDPQGVETQAVAITRSPSKLLH